MPRAGIGSGPFPVDAVIRRAAALAEARPELAGLGACVLATLATGAA